MEALRRGYKVLIVGYRGSSGMKLTSRKMYHLYAWEDLSEALEYVYEKHARV
jgi:predicted alpha/beta-fold hydrolase